MIAPPETTAAAAAPRREHVGHALPLALAGVLAAAVAAPAYALEVLPDEKAGREACEKRACQLILDRNPSGPPLACNMTKTWDRDKIKKNGEKKRMTWGFGDARCQMTLRLERSLLVPALKEAKYTLHFPPQKVVCQIEDSEKKAKPLVVTAAPKIKFKGGQADKVWINVTEVEGEGAAKSLVWTAAKLADGLGIFHKDTVNSINTFVHQTCPTEFGANAKPVKAEAVKPAAVKAETVKPAAAKADTAAKPVAPSSPSATAAAADKPEPARSFRMQADPNAKPATADTGKPVEAKAN